MNLFPHRRTLRCVALMLIVSSCANREKRPDGKIVENIQYKDEGILSSIGFKSAAIATSKLKSLGDGQHRLVFKYPNVLFIQSGGGTGSKSEDASDLEDQYNEWPGILVKAGKLSTWKSVYLKKEFSRYRWTHVTADFPTKRYWGLLEYTVAGPGSDVPVIYSQDGGISWLQIAAIPKPHHMARAKTFRMDASGRGYVEMDLDHGILLDPLARRGVNRIYRAITLDWGKTWSLNVDRFEVDVLATSEHFENVDCHYLSANWWKSQLPKDCELPKSLRSFQR